MCKQMFDCQHSFFFILVCESCIHIYLLDKFKFAFNSLFKLHTHTLPQSEHEHMSALGVLLRMEHGFVSVNVYNFICEMFLIIAISNNLKINNDEKRKKKKRLGLVMRLSCIKFKIASIPNIVQQYNKSKREPTFIHVSYVYDD